MKKVFLATTALASSVMFANSAHALTSTFTADIDVLDALSMSQNTQMNFGKMATPSADVVVHLTQAGGNGGSTTATMIDTASMAAGSIKIAGSSASTISISGADGGGVAGFEFTQLNCKFNAGAESDIIGAAKTAQAAPGVGKNLVCGAKLSVADAVVDGTYAPDYDITVNYE